MALHSWTILAVLLLFKGGPGLYAAETESCAAFNARLGSFHSLRAAEFTAKGRRHRDLEAALKAEVENDRALAASLRRQAARSRSRALRELLTAQARSALEAAGTATARLEETVREQREDEERFKDIYKIQARSLLGKRPRGCAVKGLEK